MLDNGVKVWSADCTAPIGNVFHASAGFCVFWVATPVEKESKHYFFQAFQTSQDFLNARWNSQVAPCKSKARTSYPQGLIQA